MYISIDDTDSKDGMCTTYLATELIKEFNDLYLVDHPRLVRLNPNVPWKTRGNGAIVLHLGQGGRKKRKIGYIDEEIYLYEGDSTFLNEALERATAIVEKWACDSEGTNPGIVISNQRPGIELYKKAVKDVVELTEVMDILDGGEYSYKGYKNKRGLIGATSALSWEPDDHTYELLTYREDARWGSERDLNDEDVKRFDIETLYTFDSYDHEENIQAIAPNSPCPVLYGVRGEEPSELMKALSMIGGERVERWLLFLTNQATDDHVQKQVIGRLRPWTSCDIIGEISRSPWTIEGGHVFFDVDYNGNTVTAAAYEPTKGFRDVVKKLTDGDKVRVIGGVRKDPITVNIEKIEILELAEKKIKKSNPKCPDCGKRMSSMGKDAGYRCKRCRIKADEDEAEIVTVDRDLEQKYYETPVVARRHLSKPLKRVEKL